MNSRIFVHIARILSLTPLVYKAVAAEPWRRRSLLPLGSAGKPARSPKITRKISEDILNLEQLPEGKCSTANDLLHEDVEPSHSIGSVPGERKGIVNKENVTSRYAEGVRPQRQIHGSRRLWDGVHDGEEDGKVIFSLAGILSSTARIQSAGWPPATKDGSEDCSEDSPTSPLLEKSPRRCSRKFGCYLDFEENFVIYRKKKDPKKAENAKDEFVILAYRKSKEAGGDVTILQDLDSCEEDLEAEEEDEPERHRGRGCQRRNERSRARRRSNC